MIVRRISLSKSTIAECADPVAVAGLVCVPCPALVITVYIM